ncbi:MAG: hypothetical protein ABIJ09_10635 [Pseudomonadota bacterium]
MLSALIVNLQVLRHRRQNTAQPTSPANPVAVVSYDAEHLRVWIENTDSRQWTLQLFCPAWCTPAAGAIELQVYGESLHVAYDGGLDTRGLMLAVARALDPWFDVTLPAAGGDSQRLALELGVKFHADMATTSTDGMVLLQCDGRGLDVEIGLDGPLASGGVVSVALGDRLLRFSTQAGQHGAEVVRHLVQTLTQLGGLVECAPRGCDDTYRVRIDLLALRPARAAA